jgi:uncharacterized protein YndB with AHSA1/START domain
MTAIDLTDRQLVLKRTYDASVERVFTAWTEADAWRVWMGPKDITTEVEEFDCRPGGAFSIVMVSSEGRHPARGKFIEVDAPRRVSLTWRWFDTPAEAEDTLMEVDMTDLGNGKTELTLTHSRFRNNEVRDRHADGWSSCFDALADFLGEKREAA